jgi:hypothetical protein
MMREETREILRLKVKNSSRVTIVCQSICGSSLPLVTRFERELYVDSNDA